MLIFKHVPVEFWCEVPYVGSILFQEEEMFELYTRTFPTSFFLERPYADPIYFISYILVAAIWFFAADSNSGLKSPAPDATHAIVNAKHA